MGNRCLVNTGPTQPQICKPITLVDIWTILVNGQHPIDTITYLCQLMLSQLLFKPLCLLYQSVIEMFESIVQLVFIPL